MDLLYDLWGKADRYDPKIFHPLIHHMVDIIATTEGIWRNHLTESTVEEIASQMQLPPNKALTWICLFTALHDIGKATPGFQKKNEYLMKRLAQSGYPFHRACEDHRVMTSHIVKDILTGGKHGIPRLSRHTTKIIYHSLGGHHGNYVSSMDLMNISERDSGRGLWEEARMTIVSTLIQILELDFDELPELKKGKEAEFMIFLTGLTTVADWISSAEEFFPYTLLVEWGITDYLSESRDRAAAALDYLGWKDKSNHEARSFKEMFPDIVNLYPLQQNVNNLSEELRKSGLVIIEAPMGEGKTEAAFFLTEKMGHELGKEGAFIALPTQATSNQMFRRLCEHLEAKDDGLKKNLALVHGQAMFSPDYQRIFVKPSIGEDLEHNVMANDWFSYKKRSLLSMYGVGTVDQALLSILPVKHFFVRLWGLSSKVIVLDEVHAYDVYMSTLLDKLLTWLSAMGSKVILLSATLPKKRREQLIEAYSGEKLDAAEPYPRVTWCSGNNACSVTFESACELYDYRPSRIKVGFMDDESPELVGIIEKSLSQGGRIAVLCNTVKSAQRRYAELKEQLTSKDVEVDILHARYPFRYREDKEGLVLNYYGKGRRNPEEKRVLVSTQIIEQSLDLDFDLMISEMAPVDLLLQRSGRLHRHNRPRPYPLREPGLLIFNPMINANNSYNFGLSEYIYDRYILLKSYLALRGLKEISFPRGIEELIENVYSEATITDEELAHEIEACKADWHEKAEKGKREAEKRMIADPGLKDPWDIMDMALREDESPETHSTLKALTRLTEPSVGLICLFRTGNGIATDTEGNCIIDLGKRPNKEDAVTLLKNALSMSDKRVVKHILEMVDTPPKWRETSLLRNHRPLVFEWDEARGVYFYSLSQNAIIFDTSMGISVV